MPMMTIFKTFNIQLLSPSGEQVIPPGPSTVAPSLLFKVPNGASPCRVLVRNIGTPPITLALDDPTTLMQGSLPDAYTLPAGQADVFVLQPGQILYAAVFTIVGFASISVSEAIPMKHPEPAD